MINVSKNNKNKSPIARTVIHVTPVSEIDYKYSAPRVTREIDAMIETEKYVPVIVSTERVLVHEIRNIFRSKVFDDSRVKIYRVPNLVEKPIYSISRTSFLSRIGYLAFNIFSQILYFFLMVLTLMRVTIKENALVIHVHNPPDIAGVAAFVVSKLRRIPYVFEIHDSTPELFSEEMGLSPDSFIYKILRLQERLVAKNAFALITVSNSMSNHYTDINVPKVVIYSGWKAQVWNPAMSSTDDLRSKYKLKDKIIILYSGKLYSGIYDVNLPIHALTYILSKHSDSILVYVGDGSDKSKLQNLAKELNVEANVLFTGFVPRSEAFEWIKTSDITVLTFVDSLSTRDAVPNKLLEYMQFGKPIVAAKLPGVREVIINGKDGMLYKPGSTEDFANCVIALIQDPKLKSNIGNNAKKSFESNYSSEKNMPKLLSLYDSVTRLSDFRD